MNTPAERVALVALCRYIHRWKIERLDNLLSNGEPKNGPYVMRDALGDAAAFLNVQAVVIPDARKHLARKLRKEFVHGFETWMHGDRDRVQLLDLNLPGRAGWREAARLHGAAAPDHIHRPDSFDAEAVFVGWMGGPC